MYDNTTPFKFPSNAKLEEEKEENGNSAKSYGGKKRNLKERQEKQYHSSNSNVLEILNDLLQVTSVNRHR